MILGLITSRAAGPIGIALAAILLLVSVSQCAGRSAEMARADRAELAAAEAQARLTTCRGSVATLKAETEMQSAAIRNLAEESTRRIEAAEQGLSAAQKARPGVEAKARDLLTNPPSGLDACARAMSAFERVKESAK